MDFFCLVFFFCYYIYKHSYQKWHYKILKRKAISQAVQRVSHFGQITVPAKVDMLFLRIKDLSQFSKFGFKSFAFFVIFSE